MPAALCRTIACVLVVLCSVPALADWPAYRGDHGRRGYHPDALEFPLQLQWVNTLAPSPAPAWPKPARGSLWQNLTHIEARVTDDIAYQPVVAQGKVLFGSSANDRLYCLDLATGEVVWSFVADAPIRYAPEVAAGKVFFGSDDGLVRCLSLVDGRLIWQHRPGADGDLIPGNGRLISPWPIRTGVLVDGGVVYACAGLFPSQGTYAVALKADDGALVWRTPLGEQSPQGYLLASADTLFVPTGRSNPFAIDKQTGAVGRSYGTPGGTYAVLADDALIAGPGNNNTLQSVAPDSGQNLMSYQGKHLAVGPTVTYFVTGEKLFALNRVRYTELSNAAAALRKELEPLGDAPEHRQRIVALQQQLAQVQREVQACVLWEVETQDHASLIAAGQHVIVGGDGRVTAYRAEDGGRAWQQRIEGAVMGLAASDGVLVATTDRGAVYLFGQARPEGGAVRTGPTPAGRVELTASQRALFDTLSQQHMNPRGYAAVLGEVPIEVVVFLTELTELRVLVVVDDPAQGEALRDALTQRGLYGRRVSVHTSADRRIPVTDYCINLVIDLSAQDNADNAWPRGEIQRVLAPSRGVALLADGEAYRRPALDDAGTWTHMYANPANDSNSGEDNLTGEVALQWFGGPGPNRMIDRHLRGPPPLAIGGRVIMVGENKLIGVDAYNGTELWELDMPESQRYAMPYDAGYIAADETHVYAAVDAEVWVVDAETGERTGRVALPRGIDTDQFHWGYLALVEGELLGSVIHADAPVVKPERAVSDMSYRSGYPLVTSVGLFKTRPGQRRPDWTRNVGVIVNGTITQRDGRVYFVESRNDAAMQDEDGRIPVETLLAADCFVVALDAESGETLWEVPVNLPNARNILYLVASEDGKLVLSTSVDAPNDTARYFLRVLDAHRGTELWKAEHLHVKGGLYHGEQVHHPVILGNRLVAEPVIYNLDNGAVMNPDGGVSPWQINRPGHSCGTMSGAGDFLFFRASNPTMLDLTDQTTGTDRFTRLAPTRAGCWINVLPAQGLVLIPEASASCVCSYALQTSMAFRPVPRGTRDAREQTPSAE
ncbi:MAG: PQQ-binding-like beta-propeller repeat protein [Phycisphaerales bacterium JB063]